MAPIKPTRRRNRGIFLYDAATLCASNLAHWPVSSTRPPRIAANVDNRPAADRLYPDMFCRPPDPSTADRQNTGGRLAGVTPHLPAVDTHSPPPKAASRPPRSEVPDPRTGRRREAKSSPGPGGNDRKMKGNDYLQQFALPNFFFFVTTAYNILRHRECRLERDFLGPSAVLAPRSLRGQTSNRSPRKRTLTRIVGRRSPEVTSRIAALFIVVRSGRCTGFQWPRSSCRTCS
jgi:hypothetical protein